MSISISISNLAKIKSANVKINGLTVISGENDTGKSTVGKAIYSIVKSINTYNTSGALDVKRAILEHMGDAIRLIGRLVTRKSEKFLAMRNEVFSYIKDSSSLSVKDDVLQPGVMEKITTLSFSDLSKMISKINKYAKDKKFWNDSLLEERLNNISQVINTYLDERILLSTELMFELSTCLGGVLTNSLHTDNDGIISLLLQDKEVLKAHFDDKAIIVNRYDKQKFDYLFDDATYIETPLLINEEFDFQYSPRSSFGDVVKKIKSAKNLAKNKIDFISEYIPGEITYENGKLSYRVAPLAHKLTLATMASGVKSFNILQLLASGGYIGGVSKLLIIDEPENHLHPEWQIKYAELIVSLVSSGVNVILTSHSPYMIEALYYYAKQKNLDENKIAFYYTNKTDEENYTEIKETKDLSVIFDKLSAPLEKLVWD